MKQSRRLQTEEQRGTFLHFFTACPLGDKGLQVSWEPYRSVRSLSQNRYYWGIVVKMIADQTGSDSDSVHEDLLYECFGEEKYTGVSGITRTRPGQRSSSMNTAEFCTYVEWCQRWAAEFLGLYIPDPGEVVL